MSRQSDLVLEILRERGPMLAEEVGRELAARGGTRAKDPVASARGALRWGGRYVELGDGRWMALIWALDGTVLPHRVLPQERERGCLRLDPDLTVLAPLVWSGALRSPAGDLRIVADGIHDPTLDAAKAVPDRFLALPYGGSLELVHLDDPEPASAQTTAVLEEVAADLLSRPRRPYPHGPVAVDDLLLEAAAISPGLLRGLTEPIGDTLRRCGLTTRRDLLGTPLTDWEWLDHDAAVWHVVSCRDWEDGDPSATPDATTWSWSNDTWVAMDVD